MKLKCYSVANPLMFLLTLPMRPLFLPSMLVIVFFGDFQTASGAIKLEQVKTAKQFFMELLFRIVILAPLPMWEISHMKTSECPDCGGKMVDLVFSRGCENRCEAGWVACHGDPFVEIPFHDPPAPYLFVRIESKGKLLESYPTFRADDVVRFLEAWQTQGTKVHAYKFTDTWIPWDVNVHIWKELDWEVLEQ